MWARSQVLLFFLASSLVAQTTPASNTSQDPQQPEFTLKEEVRNVVVDVVVTDKHGQPVKGLGKSAFQLLENGKPQEIAFFEEHGPDDRASNALPQPQLPPDTYTNVSAVPDGGPLLVLLLDAVNTRFDQQSYVHAQMTEYLKSIPPGTRMAIFTFGDRLQLVQGFTSDPTILKAALSNRSYPTTTAIGPGGLMSTGMNIMTVRQSLLRFGNGPSALGDELRVRYTLDALNAIAAYLADIPGRKSLIWFAGSVPWTINPDFSLVTAATGRVDYSAELKQLANVMTLGRIAVYPIDARGLATPPAYGAGSAPTAGPGMMGDPSSGGPSFHSSGGSAMVDPNRQGGDPVSSGTAAGNREMASQMNLAGNHMSMSNLAEATGGRALYNTNGLAGAVGKVQAIGSDYYSIAYAPSDRRYDGNLRKIDVLVSQPSVKLEYRRGYYAEDPDRTVKRSQVTYSADPLREAMKRGAPDSTQIPFHVQVREAGAQPAQPEDRIGNEAAKLKGPVVRYDFHWDVDPAGIAFTTADDGTRSAEVAAALDVYDAEGAVLNDIYEVLPIHLSDAQYTEIEKTGLHMKETFDVPAGVVYLRAAVVDPNSGHTGATEFPLAVAAH
jgi:VWFA-related protein